jgi:hypothetical protein
MGVNNRDQRAFESRRYCRRDVLTAWAVAGTPVLFCRGSRAGICVCQDLFQNRISFCLIIREIKWHENVGLQRLGVAFHNLEILHRMGHRQPRARQLERLDFSKMDVLHALKFDCSRRRKPTIMAANSGYCHCSERIAGGGFLHGEQ